ncbi:MAG: ribose-phosphate diphosphokinase, partial [Euryarchaeota archaeon]|nr:ribose-phosphate diphosphokinase [Euryarchaeota archaeon]
ILAKEVADELGSELGQLTIKNFPDGERYLRIDSDVKGKDCVAIQSTSKPQDSNLFELLAILETLKDMGAGKISTVVPYFGYGRQDKRFLGGEAVSARVAAKHIQMNSDEFFTVNVHQTEILKFFSIPVAILDAAPVLGDYFKIHQLEAPVVIGPDKGAIELAKSVAGIVGCGSDYIEKRRIAPGQVEMKPKNLDVANKDVILVDDMIDTGSTMIEAINMLRAQKAGNVLVGCVHPVLTGNVVTRLFGAGAVDAVATNTIPSQISFITVAPLIANALKKE